MTSRLLCLTGLLLLTSCQQSRPVVVDHQPHLDVDGQRRSVVLDTPLLAYLRNQDPVAEGTAWYDGRNDRSPAVFAGYDLPAVQRSVTITRDRQHQFNGRVHDHFSSTTYRAEYRGRTR